MEKLHTVEFPDFYSVINTRVIKRWIQHVACNDKEEKYIKGLLGMA